MSIEKQMGGRDRDGSDVVVGITRRGRVFVSFIAEQRGPVGLEPMVFREAFTLGREDAEWLHRELGLLLAKSS